MISRGASSVTLTGFTDNAGTRAADLALGLSRAKAVTAFLRHQLKVDGYSRAVAFHVTTLGKAQPLESNATAAGRSANSRVEVVALF
jgi:outer membrane protein OmpA-like peptidoglycan-associated protein